MPRRKTIREPKTNRVLVDCLTLRKILKDTYLMSYSDQYTRQMARQGKIPGTFSRQSWYFNVEAVAQALGVAMPPQPKTPTPQPEDDWI